MLSKQEKCCEACGKLIFGRIDKRFCSDQCRSYVNNRINSDVTNYIRNVNNALRRNRRILLELNLKGLIKINREKLLAKGFDFSCYTSTDTTKEGAKYFYCYDQGYLPIEKGYFLLVVKREV
jgi:predicted nucleic acid-binding Zn ribbon protein